MNRTGSNQTFAERLRRFVNIIDWGWLLMGVVIGLILRSFLDAVQPPNIDEFLDNMTPEMVGIIFTVVILERLNTMRERRQMIQQLVRRAHSRYSLTAINAIEELRVLGELANGSLSGLSLRGSNWKEANLYKADLSDTDLTNAILEDADLVLANLRSAKLSTEQMASTFCMYKAIMPDGQLYDGRFNLPGDLDHATRSGVDIKSKEAMAAWYGVDSAHYDTVQIDYSAYQRNGSPHIPGRRG